MCEHSGKLVAWMDGELEGGEAANIQHHLADCADCRLCVSEFRRITGEFAEHCDAVLKSVQPARNMWVPLRWAAVTACAVGLMFAMLAHRGTGVEKQLRPPAATDSSAPLSAKTTKSVPAPMSSVRKTVHRRHVLIDDASRGTACCTPSDLAGLNANWVAEGPSVQIAIPAAAMFPPGSVPDGMTFVADLSIGADGSAWQVLLEPQVSEFQKRGS